MQSYEGARYRCFFFCWVLKEYKSEIRGQLTEGFRKSLDTGMVSVSWRQAHGISVYKKEDQSSKQNYRPIGLTSAVGKMLEPVLPDNMRDHCDRHSLIHTMGYKWKVVPYYFFPFTIEYTRQMRMLSVTMWCILVLVRPSASIPPETIK